LYGVSVSTIKRKFKFSEGEHCIKLSPRDIVVLMDTTYWGRNWGLLVMSQAYKGLLLWKKYVGNERLSDYKKGIDQLESMGCFIDGIVCD